MRSAPYSFPKSLNEYQRVFKEKEKYLHPWVQPLPAPTRFPAHRSDRTALDERLQLYGQVAAVVVISYTSHGQLNEYQLVLSLLAMARITIIVQDSTCRLWRQKLPLLHRAIMRNLFSTRSTDIH